MKTAMLVALCLSVLPAQEMVRLADGSVVEARVRRKGKSVHLLSVFGFREAAGQDVVEVFPAQGLLATYEELAKEVPADAAAEHRALGQWCLKKGLLSCLRRELEALLAVDMDDVWARKVIHDLAGEWRVHVRETGTRGRDRRAFLDHLLWKLAATDRVGAALAREKISSLPTELLVRPLIKALKRGRPGTRWLAAGMLRSYRHVTDRIAPLYRCCLKDPSRMVRREAVRSLAVTRDPVFVRLFARNLGSRSRVVRMHAAEAIGAFGLEEGVAPLIRALQAASHPTRNNIQVTQQTAYVKDFDVEVAQGAVIADPVVDVAQDGVVLDVGLVGISQERRTLAAALVQLTGADFGTDAAAWSRFWRKKQN